MLAFILAICAVPSHVRPARAQDVVSNHVGYKAGRALRSRAVFSVDLADDDVPFKAFIDNRRTLHLEGTDVAETIVAEVIGDPAAVAIDYRRTDGATASKVSFRLDAFDRLVVNARGGSDFVNIIDAAELLDARKKALSLDGGDGDNIVVLSHLPFKPETATQLMRLLNLSKQMEDVAKQAGDATSQAAPLTTSFAG